MVSKAGVQGSIVRENSQDAASFPSLVSYCGMQWEGVYYSSGSGIHSTAVSKNPEKKRRTVVIFWN